MDLVISFDDTGSMSSIRHEVRRKIDDLVTILFNVIPDLRVGICIHNDYGDVDCYHQFPLTSNRDQIKAALNKVIRPGGYGNQAAYELPLHNLHTTFDWKSDKRIAIIIGDEVPNKVGMIRGIHNNTYDWITETEKCAKAGIKVYGVHALGQARTRPFYERISRITDGIKLDLAQFAHIATYITAIAFKNHSEEKLAEFEKTDSTFNTNFALKNMFAKLRGGIIDAATEAKVQMMGRFQVMDVAYRTKITDFVAQNGVRYVKGRGFYQLIKPETVQDYKEIIMVNKQTGETIPDQKTARAKLGLPATGVMKINPRNIAACHDYDVYIQSTSFTRQLDANTKFLYELDNSK